MLIPCKSNVLHVSLFFSSVITDCIAKVITVDNWKPPVSLMAINGKKKKKRMPTVVQITNKTS